MRTSALMRALPLLLVVPCAAVAQGPLPAPPKPSLEEMEHPGSQHMADILSLRDAARVSLFLGDREAAVETFRAAVRLASRAGDAQTACRLLEELRAMSGSLDGPLPGTARPRTEVVG